MIVNLEMRASHDKQDYEKLGSMQSTMLLNYQKHDVEAMAQAEVGKLKHQLAQEEKTASRLQAITNGFPYLLLRMLRQTSKERSLKR